MPISKQMAGRYPADWRVRRRFIIEHRARNRCEWCGAANHEPHPDTGRNVVLTLAHVWDKAPENASLLNLAALCQRCHNRWDAADRRESKVRRVIARRLMAGQLVLPDPPVNSIAAEVWQELVDQGLLTSPVDTIIQLRIPNSAYERVG